MLPMVEELGWSRAEYTIPRSLGFAVMALLGFIIGTYVDRYGGRRFMVAGVIVAAAALWWSARVTTLLEWILINGVLLTMGAAMMGNLVVNVTLSKWFVERRGFAVAMAAMGVSAAGVVVTPAVGWVAETYGWRFAWEVLAVSALVTGLPVALMVRRMPEDHGLHPDGRTDEDVASGKTALATADFANSMTRGEAVRTGAFYALIVAFGLFTINIGVVLLHGVPYVVDSGFSATFGAQMILVISIPAALTKPIWGYFIDRVAARPLGALGSAVTGGALLLIVYATSSGSVPLMYFAYFMLGVGWGGMIPIQEVIWAGFFGRRYLGAVRSAAMPFSLVLGAGAPLAVAYVHDTIGRYDESLAIVASANLVAAVLILFVRPPLRPETA